jgi:hypothetical protein
MFAAMHCCEEPRGLRRGVRGCLGENAGAPQNFAAERTSAISIKPMRAGSQTPILVAVHRGTVGVLRFCGEVRNLFAKVEQLLVTLGKACHVAIWLLALAGEGLVMNLMGLIVFHS